MRAEVWPCSRYSLTLNRVLTEGFFHTIWRMYCVQLDGSERQLPHPFRRFYFGQQCTSEVPACLLCAEKRRLTEGTEAGEVTAAVRVCLPQLDVAERGRAAREPEHVFILKLPLTPTSEVIVTLG